MVFATLTLYKYFMIMPRFTKSNAFWKSRNAANKRFLWIFVVFQITPFTTMAAYAVLRDQMNPNFSSSTKFLEFNCCISLSSSNLLKHRFNLELRVIGLNSSRLAALTFLGIIIKRLLCQILGVIPRSNSKLKI